jgi:hypothetical protein
MHRDNQGADQEADMITRRCIGLALVATLATTYATAESATTVPFHASIQTQPTVTGECGPGCLALDIPGSGTASQMGAISVAGPSQLNLFAGTQTATSTMTAANGDTLIIEVSGTFQQSGPEVTDPVTFSGTWTVIGGTGRFEATSGMGSYSGSAGMGAGTFELTGSISPPGRHR